MLRNDLITLLAEAEDNNAVTVSVNGALVDVDSVSAQDGSIVLLLDPEDLQDTLKRWA
jgi:uncharacterized protein YmfQ (DUF2313 family)